MIFEEAFPRDLTPAHRNELTPKMPPNFNAVLPIPIQSDTDDPWISETTLFPQPQVTP